MSSDSMLPVASTTPAAPPVSMGDGTPFLDPQALILASNARRFIPRAWPLLVGGLVAITLTAAGGESEQAFWREALLTLFLGGSWIGYALLRRSFGRAIDAEIAAVTTLEELVQLRRWTEAATIAQQVLSRPMFLRERRVNALLSLAALLTRYHRFEDARQVHEYLLADGELDFIPDPSVHHSVRVARAIGMLREDHLVDADKAIGDLRREVNRARDERRREQGNDAANGVQSGGLALVEMYRDIKTRHFEEACEIFNRMQKTLQQQLGMRIADAWVLVAAAHDALGQQEAAQEAYANATTLAPAIELHRRYPETQHLSTRYQPARWPGQGGLS